MTQTVHIIVDEQITTGTLVGTHHTERTHRIRYADRNGRSRIASRVFEGTFDTRAQAEAAQAEEAEALDL